MSDNAWALAPYLRVDNANEAIAWYVRALGAVEKDRYEMPDGKIMHAELDVHGCVVYLADVEEPGQFKRPKNYNEVPIGLAAQISDVDAVFKRAIEAGVQADREPADQGYGQRTAGFVDPYGHVWYVAMPLRASGA